MSNLIERIAGRWAGRKCLILNWLPEPESFSDSNLRATGVVNDNAVELRYDWSYEDQPRHGLLLLVLKPDSTVASGAWVDSWHQGGGVLSLSGSYDDERIDVLGHFAVEGSADWGWRMVLEFDGDDLLLKMFTREPGGEDERAVEIRWHPRGE